jgi:hypothetical protein
MEADGLSLLSQGVLKHENSDFGIKVVLLFRGYGSWEPLVRREQHERNRSHNAKQVDYSPYHHPATRTSFEQHSHKGQSYQSRGRSCCVGERDDESCVLRTKLMLEIEQ